MHNKAQSSMEYVSTYIYTGLALVIVVGAMSYFGAFNPSTYTKENCESGTQLTCQDAIIQTNGTVQILLINKLDRNITIHNYTIYYTNNTYFIPSVNQIVGAKEEIIISHTLPESYFSAGAKETVTYEVHYQPIDSNNHFIIRGTATTRVEE